MEKSRRLIRRRRRRSGLQCTARSKHASSKRPVKMYLCSSACLCACSSHVAALAPAALVAFPLRPHRSSADLLASHPRDGVPGCCARATGRIRDATTGIADGLAAADGITVLCCCSADDESAGRTRTAAVPAATAVRSTFTDGIALSVLRRLLCIANRTALGSGQQFVAAVSLQPAIQFSRAFHFLALAFAVHRSSIQCRFFKRLIEQL